MAWEAAEKRTENAEFQSIVESIPAKALVSPGVSSFISCGYVDGGALEEKCLLVLRCEALH